ncbi:MAG: phytoene/squalene synthase family protein [Deltaproteobacteria bacterium]|nr:phytoene/squalene synthase family protein [Deltaproteobacteria bacterium]
MNELSDLVFQQRLLVGVSRSFAFTIPQLPEALRNIVTNAYLLFRVADTIEDETALTFDQKQSFWGRFIAAVFDNGAPERLVNDLLPFLSGTTSSAERELIRNLNHIIRITRNFKEHEQEALKRSLRLMCAGMEWFQNHRSSRGLRNLAELNDYCYYVAGVVGELLTYLFCDYSVEISKKRITLLKLAVSFGQGLQMTNILKDLWEDRTRGVCWLPQDVFKKAGLDLAEMSRERNHHRFSKGLSELIAIAHAHLKNGLAYTLLLPGSEKGLRKFCLWAIGMAIFTLRKIRRDKYLPNNKEVKVSRRCVRGIIWATHFTVKSNILLKILFYLSSKPLSKGIGLEGAELTCADLQS